MVDELNLLERTIRQQQNRYYGKYRAFVTDNADPERLGRCKLTIPSVLGETESVWALPAAVYGGAAGIGIVAVPPTSAQVLAEFLEGDPSSPMWTGCFWRGSEPPPEAFTASPEPTAKVAATEAGHVLVFEDKAGEEAVTLTSAAGAVLEMDPGGSFALTDSSGATVTLDAETGQVVIEDANGNAITLSRSGIRATDAYGNEITTSSSGITVSGTTIKIEGQSVSVGGLGGEPLIKGQSFMAAFNTHTHPCAVAGSPSGPPLAPLTPAAMTTKTTAS